MDKFDELIKKWQVKENNLSCDKLFERLERLEKEKKPTFPYWKWALSIAACVVIALGIYIHNGGFYPLDKEGMIYNAENTKITTDNTTIQECNLSSLKASGIMDGSQSDFICYAILTDVSNEK